MNKIEAKAYEQLLHLKQFKKDIKEAWRWMKKVGHHEKCSLTGDSETHLAVCTCGFNDVRKALGEP